MNPAEAAVLLSAISANDNREVTEAGARALAAALPDIELADALEFLPKFYRAATRDSKNWIYPGDVVGGVTELHKDRRWAVLRAAAAEAVEGRSEDEDEVAEAGGLNMIAMRARVQAAKEYDAKHQAVCLICADEAEREQARRAAEERKAIGW